MYTQGELLRLVHCAKIRSRALHVYKCANVFHIRQLAGAGSTSIQRARSEVRTLALLIKCTWMVRVRFMNRYVIRRFVLASSPSFLLRSPCDYAALQAAGASPLLAVAARNNRATVLTLAFLLSSTRGRPTS